MILGEKNPGYWWTWSRPDPWSWYKLPRGRPEPNPVKKLPKSSGRWTFQDQAFGGPVRTPGPASWILPVVASLPLPRPFLLLVDLRCFFLQLENVVFTNHKYIFMLIIPLLTRLQFLESWFPKHGSSGLYDPNQIIGSMDFPTKLR